MKIAHCTGGGKEVVIVTLLEDVENAGGGKEVVIVFC